MRAMCACASGGGGGDVGGGFHTSSSPRSFIARGHSNGEPQEDPKKGTKSTSRGARHAEEGTPRNASAV